MLNNRKRLLADEPVTGEPDELPSTVAGGALMLHARVLILVRVVPAGPMRKVLPEWEAVLNDPLIKALGMLSITLHDHVLIRRGSMVSLRQRGLLSTALEMALMHYR